LILNINTDSLKIWKCSYIKLRRLMPFLIKMWHLHKMELEFPIWKLLIFFFDAQHFKTTYIFLTYFNEHFRHFKRQFTRKTFIRTRAFELRQIIKINKIWSGNYPLHPRKVTMVPLKKILVAVFWCKIGISPGPWPYFFSGKKNETTRALNTTVKTTRIRRNTRLFLFCLASHCGGFILSFK